MSQLGVLLASLGAVLALALIARLLGLGGAPRLADEGEAIAEARAHHFEAVTAELTGEGAIVRDATGRRARLRPHGNHFVLDA